MLPDSDLKVLKAFNGRGHITLSAYLRLDTPELRESAYQDFVREVSNCLDDCAPQPDCRKAIQEDVEIVGLYLRTNGHRRHVAIAIFSCAAELFWRAYPLSVPVPTQVSVGPTFNVEPLLRVVAR